MTLASPFVAAGGKGESKSSRQLETDRFAVDFHLAAPGKSPSRRGSRGPGAVRPPRFPVLLRAMAAGAGRGGAARWQAARPAGEPR